MSDVNVNLRNLGTSHSYASSDPAAWEGTACPHCGAAQMIRVVRETYPHDASTDGQHTRWLRCPSCQKGALIQDRTLYPAAMPMRVPLGLPPADADIWTEVRKCLGAGAFTASVMLCRKLLFHIAVAHKMKAKNDKGWAPTFQQAVDHLEKEGIVTKRMRPWVDRIKDIGNDANHELTPVGQAQAEDVAAFTEQLLELAYEMDAKMAATAVPEPEPDETA